MLEILKQMRSVAIHIRAGLCVPTQPENPAPDTMARMIVAVHGLDKIIEDLDLLIDDLDGVDLGNPPFPIESDEATSTN